MPAWDIAIQTNGEQSYSNSKDLSAGSGVSPSFAYCLPDYAIFDGTFKNAPDIIPANNYGYISTYLSDENGAFLDGNTPIITVTYDRYKTSNGIMLAFNQLSGDYCTEVEITWLKGEEEIYSETFYPDNVEYFCKASVSLFDKIVIVLKKTSRPIRYAWITTLQNQRLTNAGGLKIVYDDIALGAKENSTAESADKEPYVDLENLKETIDFPEYALCYQDYSLLDGDYSNVPNNTVDMGYVSHSISDGDGVFSSPPQITFSLADGNYSSVGITLTFNEYSEDYCSRLKIEWYRDAQKLSEKEFTPSDISYFCYNVVELYNKLVITFLETSRPYRPVFLTAIDYGLQRIFQDDEAYNVDCIMEVDEISSELPSNVLNFAVKTDSEYVFDFQKKQSVRLYFDEFLMGQFYLSDGKRKSKWDYEVQTQDAIGLLDGSQFYGGIYVNAPVNSMLQAVFEGEGIEYFLDDAYSNTVLSGYIPICTKRDALQQIAFTIGAVVNTAYNQVVQIYPKQEEVTADFPLSTTYTGLTVEHNDIVTGVRVYAHQYTKINEEVEIFKGALQGESIIEFSEPYHSLGIVGGSITKSGSNYAYIKPTLDEVTLTGKKYSHNTFTVLKEDAMITSYKNIAEVKDATLVNESNVNDVAERLFDYYRNNEYVTTKAIIDEQEVGQKVTIDTGYDGEKTGTIRKMDFAFTREINAEVTIG